MKKFSILILFLLSACQTAPLSYRINPDLSALSALQGKAAIISLTAIDKRDNNSTSVAKPTQPIAEALTGQMKKMATQSGLKIITNPLLADLALSVEIEQFDVKVEQGTFSSKLKVKSKFTLIVQKKSDIQSKRFSSMRTQEVANPVNNNDVTGIVNQILSEQFNLAMADPTVKAFLTN